MATRRAARSAVSVASSATLSASFNFDAHASVLRESAASTAAAVLAAAVDVADARVAAALIRSSSIIA